MRGAVHMQITTIGLDIAKNVFQVHGIDADEKVVVRKQLRRSQVMAFFAALSPCLIGLEACATAHYWERELRKLGHQVRLMPMDMVHIRHMGMCVSNRTMFVRTILIVAITFAALFLSTIGARADGTWCANYKNGLTN